MAFSRICMKVGSASYMTGLFQVPLDAARSLVPDDYFQVAEIFPAKAVFFVGTGEFRQSDIGPYRELYVGFYTENRESAEAPTRESNLAEFTRNESKMFMMRNWVSTPAAFDQMDRAGSAIFRLGDVEREDGPTSTTFSVVDDEVGSVRFSTPREGDVVSTDFGMKRTHYGRLHGEPSRCLLNLTIDKMVTSPGKGEFALGGKLAADCERLELPTQPLVAIWIEEMRFELHKPVALRRERPPV